MSLLLAVTWDNRSSSELRHWCDNPKTNTRSSSNQSYQTKLTIGGELQFSPIKS
jgi:hypothetical protein